MIGRLAFAIGRDRRQTALDVAVVALAWLEAFDRDGG